MLGADLGKDYLPSDRCIRPAWTLDWAPSAALLPLSSPLHNGLDPFPHPASRSYLLSLHHAPCLPHPLPSKPPKDPLPIMTKMRLPLPLPYCSPLLSSLTARFFGWHWFIYLFIYLFIFGPAHGMQKFWGLGLKSAQCCRGNTRSLTCQRYHETPSLLF